MAQVLAAPIRAAKILVAVAIAASGLTVSGLAASGAAAQVWQPQTEGSLTRAVICPKDGRDGSGQFSCLMLECAPPERPRFVIAFTGTAFADRFSARLLVDGVEHAPLPFARQPSEGYFLAHAPTDPARDAALIAALKLGNRVEVIITQGGLTVPFLYLPLTGAAAAINSVEAACPVTPPDQTKTELGTPESSPARYASPQSIGRTDAASETLARQLMAEELASMGAEARVAEVFATLIALDRGPNLLITDLCHPTWFGVGGCETHVHAAPASGAPMQQVAEVMGGSKLWLDQTVIVMGYPDLVVQSIRGTDQPFGRWRWNGRAYAFAESFR